MIVYIKGVGGLGGKFLLIQGLRAYACLFVIIYHMLILFHNGDAVWKEPWVNLGHLGVIQFFFISGFVITMVAMRENRFEFIVKRFFRIFPPILFSLVLIVVAYVFCYLTGSTRFINNDHFFHTSIVSWDGLTIGRFLKNLFLVNVDINDVMWTLQIESAFYILVFLFLPYLQAKPTEFYVAICSFFVGWYVLKNVWHVPAMVGFYEHYYKHCFVYMIYLILGSLFYLWYAKKIKHISFVVLSVVFLILILRGIGWYCGFYAVHVGLSYGLLVLSVYLNNRIPVPKWLVSFGNISYSAYLDHQPIGVIVTNMSMAYFGYSVWKHMFMFLALLLFVVIISTFSYRYIEVPSQRLARNLIREVSSARFAVRVPLYVGSFVPFLMFLIYPLCKFLIFMCKVYL